jgi:hypothetical protein
MKATRFDQFNAQYAQITRWIATASDAILLPHMNARGTE